MATDAPSVKFKVSDFTNNISNPVEGITYLMGKSLRGPFNKPDQVINSWPMFVRYFGGLTSDIDTLLVKRLLDKGGKIRFCKLGHYTTIANRSTLSATKAEAAETILDADDVELFELVPKNEGADYNNLIVSISQASNGLTEYFNLTISHDLEPDLTETYTNLSITGTPTVLTSNYLKDVVDNSSLVDVVYKDLSGLTLSVSGITTRPIDNIILYAGGTDSGVIVDADIIGDSASNTGFHAFDDYDDSYQVMVLSGASVAVHTAGNAYATNRQDLQYWIYIPNSNTNQTSILSYRTSLAAINNEYSAIFQGGIMVTNPVNSQAVSIEPITDIAALATRSEAEFGPFFSFSGNKRGNILDALSVVNNFGTPARAATLNLFTNRQINSVIFANNQIKLWGGFTTSIGNNQRKYISVVRGILYIKKSLRPTLENYLEEPNDIPTWKSIYNECKIFLDKLIEKRALYSYEWHGDQDAANLDELQINSKPEVMDGKYKVKLILSFIPGLQSIEINLILSNGTLSFENINSLTQ